MDDPNDTAGGEGTSARGCLIVEDRPDTRAWLQGVVAEAFPGMVVATAATLREARAWLADHVADPPRPLALAVVDLGLPDGSGIDLVAEIERTSPGTVTVVATIYDDDAHLFDSLAAGAQGYILKTEQPEAVADCLRRIDAGEPPLSPSIARRLIDHLRGRTPPKPIPDEALLSPRETEVLTLIARGLTAPEAARQIGLQPQTVAGYVKVIYQKLHVSSRAEAVLAAAARGLT